MVHYIFKFDDMTTQFKYNDSATPSTDDIVLPLDMESIMNKNEANDRTRDDMYKDADENPSINDIKTIIETTFGMKQPPQSTTNAYKKRLSKLDTKFSSAGHETLYFNIIKTSTGGPDPTKYQLTANNILHESGMKPKKISNAPNITVITTPAARLDPASKTGATEVFPDASTSITFDSSFTERLGFPHKLVWTTTNTTKSASDVQSFDVTIKTTRFTDLEAKGLLLNTKQSSTPSELEQYSLAGNKKKNEEITRLWAEWNKPKDATKKDELLNEIYKYLLLKELGDVVQVFLYYALIVIKTIGFNTDDILNFIKTYLMITTDSIVFFLCKAFGLPAAYSGSRAGVQSGHCTLRYFLIGDADFKAHLINLFEIEYNKILGHNNLIKNVLEKIINKDRPNTNLKIFNFHIKLPSTITVQAPRDTTSYYASNTPVPGNIYTLNGNHLINQALKADKPIIHIRLKESLSKLVTDIETKNEALEKYYKEKKEEFEAIKSETLTSIEHVTTKYDDFQKKMQETMKCEQYITVLPEYNKGVKFIFNDTSKLYIPDIKFKINLVEEVFAFKTDMIPTMITDAAFDPKNAAVDAAAAAAEGSSQITSQKSGGLSRSSLRFQSGGTPPGSDADYYEHLLMYFVYTFFFKNQKITKTTIDETTFNPELFATYYDMFVWKCENRNWKIDKIDKIYINHFDTIFNNITDEQIQEYGEMLSKYIYLYDNENTDIELKKVLQTEIESETPLSSLSETQEGGPSTPNQKNRLKEPVTPRKPLVSAPLEEEEEEVKKAQGKKKSRKRSKRSKRSKRGKRSKRSKRSKRGKRNKRDNKTRKNKKSNYQ